MLVDAIIGAEHGLRDGSVVRSGVEIILRRSSAFPRGTGLCSGFLGFWILTGPFSSFLNGAAASSSAFSVAASFRVSSPAAFCAAAFAAVSSAACMAASTAFSIMAASTASRLVASALETASGGGAQEGRQDGHH